MLLLIALTHSWQVTSSITRVVGLSLAFTWLLQRMLLGPGYGSRKWMVPICSSSLCALLWFRPSNLRAMLVGPMAHPGQVTSSLISDKSCSAVTLLLLQTIVDCEINSLFLSF